MARESEQISSTEVTLDLAQALQNLGNDAELLHEIAIVFIEDVPEIIGQLESACLRADTTEMTRLAHSLKGLSATFGAEPARTYAQTLEVSAADIDQVVMRDRVQVLIAVLEQTILQLRQRLSI